MGAGLPLTNGRLGANPYAHQGNQNRSQSHTAGERQRYYAVPPPVSSSSQPGSPRQARANSISFGDFSSNMGNMMDTALARAEDRRRKGMVNDAIAFGDIRVSRTSSSGMPDIDRAKETFLRNRSVLDSLI